MSITQTTDNWFNSPPTIKISILFPPWSIKYSYTCNNHIQYSQVFPVNTTTAFPPPPTFQLGALVYIHSVMLPHLSDPVDRFLPISNYLLYFLCFLICLLPSFPIHLLLSFPAGYRQLQLHLVWMSLCVTNWNNPFRTLLVAWLSFKNHIPFFAVHYISSRNIYSNPPFSDHTFLLICFLYVYSVLFLNNCNFPTDCAQPNVPFSFSIPVSLIFLYESLTCRQEVAGSSETLAIFYHTTWQTLYSMLYAKYHQRTTLLCVAESVLWIFPATSKFFDLSPSVSKSHKINDRTGIHVTFHIYVHKILTCFKRNTVQKYRHKSQFPTYSKNSEVIIHPTTIQGVQENKTGYTKWQECQTQV
jgi:hypothetical protein